MVRSPTTTSVPHTHGMFSRLKTRPGWDAANEQLEFLLRKGHLFAFVDHHVAFEVNHHPVPS